MKFLLTVVETLSAIKDPVTLMFITVLAVLGIVGLALYVVVIALKRGGRP